MTTKHALSFALSGVTVIAGLLAAWAVLASGSTTQGLPRQTPPTGVSISPTPSLLADVPDAAAAFQVLRSTSPRAAAAIEHVLRDGGKGAAELVRWKSVECQNTGIKGVSGCQLYSVAPGTILESWNPEEGVLEYELQRRDAEAMLAYDFDGRHPQLDLIARREDGIFLIVMGVDARPDVSFPGVVPTNSGDTIAMELRIDGPTGDVLAVSSKPAGRPPLETIRYEEHHGRKYEILGKSQAFAERESAFAAELEAHAHDPVSLTPAPTR